MKVLLDTNVVVSAALKDGRPEAVVVWVATSGECDWIVSQDILAEYREVLRRPKFGLPEHLLEHWDEILRTLTSCVEVPELLEFPRDPADSLFLSCALASEADYFVTGDRDFDEARKLVKTTILSVSRFHTLFCFE